MDDMTEAEREAWLKSCGPGFLQAIIELNRILHKLDIEPKGLEWVIPGIPRPFTLYGMRFSDPEKAPSMKDISFGIVPVGTEPDFSLFFVKWTDENGRERGLDYSLYGINSAADLLLMFDSLTIAVRREMGASLKDALCPCTPGAQRLFVTL